MLKLPSQGLSIKIDDFRSVYCGDAAGYMHVIKETRVFALPPDVGKKAPAKRPVFSTLRHTDSGSEGKTVPLTTRHRQTAPNSRCDSGRDSTRKSDVVEDQLPEESLGLQV